MDTQYFKEKLEKELSEIQEELAFQNEQEVDADTADETEMGDKFEEMAEDRAIEGSLGAREKDIKAALVKIEEGTYGNCEVCGKPIEEDRLGANPSARTCKEHMQ